MLKNILKYDSAFSIKLALTVVGITCNYIIINNSPAQAANLITNGSFEIGTNPGNSFITLDSGSSAITGWTVTGPIDYVANWQASQGSRSLDLNGPSPGGVQQIFNTTPGQTYLVNFDLAGNPDYLPLIKSMTVMAAAQSAAFNFDTTGKSTTNMGWETKSWQFTANATTTTLEFFSTIDGIAGPTLDNVSVTAQSIPEPFINPLCFLGVVTTSLLFSRRRLS